MEGRSYKNVNGSWEETGLPDNWDLMQWIMKIKPTLMKAVLRKKDRYADENINDL